MRYVSFASAALSALTYSTLASAAIQKTCPNSDDLCYSVAVPESSAKSGSGNIYFQIQAPTSYTWVALGTGSRMSGSYMFIMYTDGAGNVTISPRLGTNHVAPVEDTSSSKKQLTLLAGSGVDGNIMRANVMCSNCESWNGGSMSLTSTSTNWIAAWKSGSAIDSTNKNQGISQHDGETGFRINPQTATVSADSNPFVSSSSGGSSSGGSSSGNSTGDSSNGGTETNTGGISFGDDDRKSTDRLVSAHGVIMAITFVILYPVGSILMPLLGKWMLHAAWQFVSFIMMWIGFGIGVVAAQKTFYNFTVTHTIFGTVIVCLMILQPVLGYLHHMYYVKHQARGVVSYAHIAYGRSLMLLGVINGGLGLQLAGAKNSLVIAYGVIAGIVGLAYLIIKPATSFRKRRANGNCGPRGSRGPRGPHGPRMRVGSNAVDKNGSGSGEEGRH